MSLGDTVKKFIGIEPIDEEFSEEEIKGMKDTLANEAPAKRPPLSVSAQPGNVGQTAAGKVQLDKKLAYTTTGSVIKIVLIEPKSFDECPKLVDSLKGRRPVVINLEKIETETAKKIFDFMSGATYALNGNVQKVANNIFIFAPENVDIAATQEDTASVDFGKNKSPWR